MSVSLRHARIAALSLFLAATVLAEDSDDLSRQATDPTASLMALNFQGLFVGAYYGPTVAG